jgi:hypothetical protein
MSERTHIVLRTTVQGMSRVLRKIAVRSQRFRKAVLRLFPKSLFKRCFVSAHVTPSKIFQSSAWTSSEK